MEQEWEKESRGTFVEQIQEVNINQQSLCLPYLMCFTYIARVLRYSLTDSKVVLSRQDRVAIKMLALEIIST